MFLLFLLKMRTYKKKTDRGKTTQDIMNQAIREVMVDKLSIRFVASKYDICHVTLSR